LPPDGAKRAVSSKPRIVALSTHRLVNDRQECRDNSASLTVAAADVVASSSGTDTPT
jgi:hypothetical protein